ncbi:hypothetical protein ACEQ8H_003576 [Pleosporales sp. CAS-2024a]
MVFALFRSSTLLQSRTACQPYTFRRYKSLTAAIERGKQSGPDSSYRPRSPEHVDAGPRKNRAQLRLERFGPPRGSDDGPYTSRDEKPRSSGSRFGRNGSRNSRNSAPSRFQKDREGAFRDRDDFPPPSRSMNSGDRFPGERDALDRFARRDRPAQRFGERDDRPIPRGSPFERGDRRRSDGDNKFKDDGRPRRESPFERGDRRRSEGDKNFQDDRRLPRESPFERGDRRRFEGNNKFKDDGRRFTERYSGEDSGREAYGRQQAPGHKQDRWRPEPSLAAKQEPSWHTGEPDASRERGEGTLADRRTAETRTTERVEMLPYSTAASEFIYGYSSVVAALKANRRKLYKLYVHSRGASRDGLMARVRALKLFPITEEVGDEYLRAMDKASSGRPHNGVVLEASPLPVLPITELKEASLEDESFSVTVDSQSAEDALVNGKQDVWSYKAAGWRHPLVLYVDGVLDEGNLGAIARSAYFLGVDAIVTPSRQTAPWGHITLKASAGAAEAIPIFKVSSPRDFLGKSARAGWRIYASDSIATRPATAGEKEEGSSKIVYSVGPSGKQLPNAHCPVAEHATILMMGAEGEGLGAGLLKLANYKVGIKHGRDVDEVGVDSLNVSVAASILCYEMLQKPSAKGGGGSEGLLF